MSFNGGGGRGRARSSWEFRQGDDLDHLDRRRIANRSDDGGVVKLGKLGKRASLTSSNSGRNPSNLLGALSSTMSSVS